jgi:hypothetical protein
MHDYAHLPVFTFISIIKNYKTKEILIIDPTVTDRRVKLSLSMTLRHTVGAEV